MDQFPAQARRLAADSDAKLHVEKYFFVIVQSPHEITQ